ncbi:MAG: hypothetical protein FMNOHCHN_02122 [Ignavibacteriaceae bacterium]|nr:hypothetical protein [Ignavibacteriaceae bacterium]
MKLYTTLLILVISSSFSRAENPVLFRGSGLAYADKMLVMTLAGIVNRDTARLYLWNVYETWSFKNTDETWGDIYRQRGGVVFDTISTVSQLVNRFRARINGGVVYDFNRFYGNFSGQSFNWQAEYASLIGGLTNRLPVTTTLAAAYNLQISDSVLAHDSFDGDSSRYLPGRLEQPQHPWNNTSLTEEQRYLALIDWGIRNILPLCNPAKFYIRELTDFTVKERMFQVNLAGTEDLNFNSLPAAKAELIERLLVFMQGKSPNDIFHIYGWMRPEPLTQWFATYNASFHETLLGNLSWHTSFRVPDETLVLRAKVNADTVEVRNKFYLLLISSEGDASNWVVGLQSGAWVSSDRGSVPFGWGINLHLLSMMPFIAKYYYDTATEKDGFISVTSPLGYAYPDLWTAAALPSAHAASIELMNHFSLKEIYGYKHYASSGSVIYRGRTINNSFNFQKYGQFQKNIGAEITFLFDPMLATQTPNQSYGSLLFNHVNDGTFYGSATDIPAMAARIKTAVRNKTKPYFYLAGYQRMRHNSASLINSPGSSDITPQKLKQLHDILKSDPDIGADIEFVTPQYFSALLRKKLGLTGAEDENIMTISDYSLRNYPNPFNSSTRIQIEIPESGYTELVIYNVAGELQEVLHRGGLEKGKHFINLDAAGYPSGIYFAMLKSGTGIKKTAKLLLMK